MRNLPHAPQMYFYTNVSCLHCNNDSCMARSNIHCGIICDSCQSSAAQVLRDKIEDSYYKLTSQTDQIRAYVFDVVRSTVPKLDLDAVFISKEDIAQDVKEQLTVSMETFGLSIIQVLSRLLSSEHVTPFQTVFGTSDRF